MFCPIYNGECKTNCVFRIEGTEKINNKSIISGEKLCKLVSFVVEIPNILKNAGHADMDYDEKYNRK